MRMQDRANGEPPKKSVGEVSDHHVQQPQDERKAVQKRAFTRWMNVFLQRRDPPVEVHDLFTDVQDGRILMALLEQLSGCKLLYRFRTSSHRIFRLNNISKALAFLDDRHVKLLGIDASGIADGVPSVVLNLVWNIILYFQVKEVTEGLQRHHSSSLSSLSVSGYPSSGDLTPQPDDIGSLSCNTLPSKGRKAAREPKYHGKAIKTLLQWVQRCTSKFGVQVRDFGRSWRSGLAFLAVIKSINPALVDLREGLSREPRENLHQAFVTAHHSLDIPPLLEPEDVLCTSPDEQSIITYVSMFLRYCTGIDEKPRTDMEDLGIPNFGSVESVSFGETLADDPAARALLKGLERSSEQQLWNQWARRSSGSPRTTSLHTSRAVTSDFSSSCKDILLSCHSQSISKPPAGCAAASPLHKNKCGHCGAFQPPSPLDAGVASQEIRSWMEKASAEQGHSKPSVDGCHFSLSSEEGIYNLSALDSDEEEAYSYILDLNKEVFQPCYQLKRQVPKVEEETAEEMFLNGEQTEESKHLEACETLNDGGCKQEGLLAQNVESDVPAESAVHQRFDWESSFRETANNQAVFGVEPEEGSMSREGLEEEKVVRGKSKDDGHYCEEERKKEKTENARLVTQGHDQTEALVDKVKKTKVSEVAGWKKEDGEEIEGEPLGECGQAREERVAGKEDKRQDRKLGTEKDEEDNLKQEKKKNQQSVVNVGSFKVSVDENILNVEAIAIASGACATGINAEDKEGYSDEVKNSMEVELVVTVEEKDREFKLRRRELTNKKATIIDNAGHAISRNDTNGGGNIHGGDNSWTPACSATSQSYRAGFFSQSLAASCDITPFELQMLLVLWILLYCCFIFPQMNL